MVTGANNMLAGVRENELKCERLGQSECDIFLPQIKG